MNKYLKFETHCVRIQAKRSSHKEHSVPIFETSSYIFNSAEEARAVFAEEEEGNIYTRFSNPNTDEFIQKLCALEGAEDGIATASGMAAVYLSLNALLRPGDHVLASRQLFGTTHLLFTQVLSKWGVSHTYVDMKDQQQWKDNLLPTTRLIYTETPSNPGMDLVDLKWLARFAAKNELYLIVDNCFATPYLQNPIPMGADIVIHSATKFIDGQGRKSAGLCWEVRISLKRSGPFRKLRVPPCLLLQPGCCLKALKLFQYGWKGIVKMRSNWPNFLKNILKLNG
jgi:O-succinylhomoserine sulfhydrylase